MTMVPDAGLLTSRHHQEDAVSELSTGTHNVTIRPQAIAQSAKASLGIAPLRGEHRLAELHAERGRT